MMKQINEYTDYPKWADSPSKKNQYDWYLEIKRSLPMLRRTCNPKIGTSDLEQAIADYEKRNNIV